MSALEIPFLRILPSATSTPEAAPHRPDPAPADLEENWRRTALSQILDSMAADMSPRHWGINE